MSEKNTGKYYSDNNTSGLDVILNGMEAISDIGKNDELLGAAALCAGVVVAPFALVANRLDNIYKNEGDARRLLEELQTISDQFTTLRGSMLRTIEIIEAVYKANNGFWAIYEPLFEKAFVRQDISSIHKLDITELAYAIKSFKKISDSKIS